MEIRTVDTTEWTTLERVEALALPYEVISSPYGETVSLSYATEDEALASARAVEAMTGEYMTSWGMTPVDTQVTVLHFVCSATEIDEPEAAPAATPTRYRAPRAIGYVVLPHGGYPDTASDYVECATRADVEAQLVDYGWMANPGVSVYKLTAGETAADTIAELSASPDPYPDWIVERGPRGGVQWLNA